MMYCGQINMGRRNSKIKISERGKLKYIEVRFVMICDMEVHSRNFIDTNVYVRKENKKL
jgi:hypothetical protein